MPDVLIAQGMKVIVEATALLAATQISLDALRGLLEEAQAIIEEATFLKAHSGAQEAPGAILPA